MKDQLQWKLLRHEKMLAIQEKKKLNIHKNKLDIDGIDVSARY